MNLVPGRAPGRAADAEALIEQAGLGEQALQAIAALRVREELGFAEAALRLGLVSQADLDRLRSPGDSPSPPLPPTAVPGTMLALAHDPFHPHGERIRALRTALLLRQGGQEPNLLAVVSSQKGEGRSRLAAELAVACAQLRQPTLLVDADLRNPEQHRLFGADNRRGLATALAESSAPLLQGVVGLPQLSLLTAGPTPANPLELLAGDALAGLLPGWRRRYRHIIVDTPAVASGSDALAVASHLGAVLVLARLHRTPMADWQGLMRRLASTRARVLGGVLNRF